MSIDYEMFSSMSMTSLAEHALKKPEDFGYWGNDDMFKTWGFTGHDRSGMSDILQEANFKGVTEDLMSKYPNDFRIEYYTHWACGWVERLTCRVLIRKENGFLESNITDAFREAMKAHETLWDEPMYNEDIYYELIGEAQIEAIRDLPLFVKNKINDEDPFWIDKIINKLFELGYDIDPVSGIYPTDNEILEVVYDLELWNPENIELWEEWCYENDREYPPKKFNPNQMNLF